MRIHRPGSALWKCWICGDPTAQRHHAMYGPYRRPHDERYALVPLCDLHHEALHRAWDALGRDVDLALFTLHFVYDSARPHFALVRPGQLTLAEQSTPQGEAWRRFEAAELRPSFAETLERARAA